MSWLSETIHKQAKMLDAEIPGWHKLVNPETLEMSSCSMCVLGQVFGLPMEQKLREILKDKCPPILPEQERYADAAFSRGLMYINKVARSSSGFGTVGTCEWVEEIAERRAKEETSTSA